MVKKDYWYAAVVGLITAFFAALILINTETSLFPFYESVEHGDVSYDVVNEFLVAFERGIWILFVALPMLEFVAYVIASKLFSHILFLKQLGRFGIVGLMNFSVDTGILTTLSVWTGIFVGVRLIPLNIVSGSVAIVNSYFWQRTWTFAEKAPPTRKEFLAFLTVTVFGIVLNSALVSLLTALVPPFDGLDTPARLEVAVKIGATLVTLFWNFLGYKFIVFR